MLPLRQGDVILIPVNQERKESYIKRDIVLALGETTGHSHRFNNVRGRMRGSPTDIGGATLFLQEESTLQHEEHGPIQVPAGTYQVLIQKEYDPTKDRSYVVD